MEQAELFFGAVRQLGRWLKVEVEGIQRLPPGRALLVANHAFGFDVVFLMAAIYDATGRPVWVLGEHLWWKVPFARRIAALVGTVDGTPENADRLLGSDQLVLVLPGGLREAVKPHELRYHLLWGHRYGFVKAALRNAAPMVPVASIGFDDLFTFYGDALARGHRWFGLAALPIPRLLSIPHPLRLRYVIGEPLPPPAPAQQADDPEVVHKSRFLIRGALQDLIDTELARRVGITQ